MPVGTEGRVQLRRYTPRDPARPTFQVFNFYGPDFSARSAVVRSLLVVGNSVPTFVGGVWRGSKTLRLGCGKLSRPLFPF